MPEIKIGYKYRLKDAVGLDDHRTGDIINVCYITYCGQCIRWDENEIAGCKRIYVTTDKGKCFCSDRLQPLRFDKLKRVLDEKF